MEAYHSESLTAGGVGLNKDRSRTHISSVSRSRFGSVIAPSKKTASSRSNRLLLPAGTLEDEKGGGVKVCVSKSEKKGSFLLSKVNRLNLVAKFIQWLLKNGEKHEKNKRKKEKEKKCGTHRASYKTGLLSEY